MSLAMANNWTLTKKFLASILVALVIVFFIMGAMIRVHEKSVLNDELRKKGDTLASLLAGISAEAMLSYNFNALESYVQAISEGDPDVVAAEVTDKAGNVLTHLRPKESGKDPVLQFTHAVSQNNETIGAAKISFTTRNMTSALQRSQMIMLGLSVGTMAVVAFVVFYLFRILAIRPIERLKRSVEAVASGDLTHADEAGSGDEIGLLFSAMKAQDRDRRCPDRGRQRGIGKRTDQRRFGADVAGDDGAGGVGRGNVCVGRRDERYDPAECGQCTPDREDRAQVGERRHRQRQGGIRGGSGHERDRLQDIHYRGDRQADEPSCTERGDRGGAGG
jgi:HAMP domain-containing protein